MVSRKSQYGIFWGCANYPKCKGTRDSMGLSADERRRAREADAEIERELEDHSNNDKYRFRKQ